MAALNATGVKVKLKKGSMKVLFDMNSLIELEDAYGDLTGFQLALSTKPFRTLRFALATAGEWDGEAVELAGDREAAVGKLIDPKRLGEVSDAVAQALRDALGVEDEPSEDPPKGAAATPSPS